MSSLWTFVLIWGVWLITPILVDGIEAIGRLVIVRRKETKRRRQRLIENYELPSVTLIVPAHNEAEVIDRCLNSIKAQDYPSDKLEVVVVDDGSTDGTADRVQEHVDACGNDTATGTNGFRLRGEPIKVGAFRGNLTLIKNGHEGKAHALNAGIRASSGEIVMNIDSDVVLAFDAVRQIAEAFVRNPKLGAATGNIEVDWDVLEARDENGNIVLDASGNIVPMSLNATQRFLAKSQFLEYLASFDLGRRAQSLNNTIYTLAGACSAFRRDVLTDDCCYTNATVSEDTALTFDLHKRGVRVGFVHGAKVYLEPVVDWDGLYAQRVRWARGQLEVCGVNESMVGRSDNGSFSRFTLPKMLLFDHTLAFPRLIWAPLIMFFPMIGYPWRIIIFAVIALYVFYLALEIVNTLAVYSIADDHTKSRIEQCGWTLLGLPIYRFVVFHFRFSGFLVTLTEEQQWTMSGPMQTTRGDLRSLRLRSIEIASSMFAVASASVVRLARFAATVLAPLLFSFVIILRWIDSMRRNG